MGSLDEITVDIENPIAEGRESEERKLLTEWEHLCEDKSMMHASSSAFFGSFVNGISIPAILVASMCSIGNIAISSNPDMMCNRSLGIDWMILGFSSLGLLATATQTIVQALGLSDLSSKNDISAGHYEKLALEIKMQSVVRPEGAAYRSLSELIKSIKRQIDTLIDTSPTIPKHIELRVANARIDHRVFRLKGDRKFQGKY